MIDHESKLCQVGRIFDPAHPTCRSCRIRCAAQCLHLPEPDLDEIGKKHGLPGKYCAYEEQEQRILAKFLDLKFPDEWFHVPNGRMRNKADAGKLKAEGVKKGIPDNFIVRPVGDAPGMVIELKRKVGGRVSPEQRKWLDVLLSNGWITLVSEGADNAIDAVRKIYRI